MVGAAGQKRVSSRFLKDTRLFVPSINEQVRIAAFLDDSCMVIDAVMTTKRRQIDALNELRSSILDGSLLNGVHGEKATKGSGSSVIPQIPSRWRVARLKSVANVRYGLGQPPAQLDSGVPMIRATDVDAGQISLDRLMMVDPEDLPLDRKVYLKAGEIIVVRSGAYTGDSAIVPPSLDGCVAGYDMVVTVERASPEFVAYCLLSRYVLQGQLFLLKQRAAQPHLNAEQLGGVVLALPPTRSEQEDIVKVLDQRLGRIVEAARCIERQTEALTSYRKSLIHECVTGQRRITEADLYRVKAHAQKEEAA